MLSDSSSMENRGVNLATLINSIEESMASNSDYIRDIMYPQKLVRSLKKLKRTTGNERLKSEVASQISHMILQRKRMRENPEVKFSPNMMNIMLAGPPGVGKTMISRILAEIYFSLGIIGNQKGSPNGNPKPQKAPEFTFNPSSGNEDKVLSIFLISLFVLSFFSAYIISGLGYMYRQVGALWVIVTVAVAILALLGFIYYMTRDSSVPEVAVMSDADLSDESKTPEQNSALFLETSRVNFVGQYVGHSAPLTKATLEASLGKVLFIDEAYSLIQAPTDTFGKEAVDFLTQFLTQHPGELIVIMAGYEDLIKKHLFENQPGLERRFMWKFTCEGYTADELFEIFEIKCEDKALKIEDKEKIRQLFHRKYKAFSSYAGDVERVLFFSEIAHDNDYMVNGGNCAADTINYDHVEKGIQSLESNKLSEGSKNERKIDEENLRSLLDIYGRRD